MTREVKARGEEWDVRQRRKEAEVDSNVNILLFKFLFYHEVGLYGRKMIVEVPNLHLTDLGSQYCYQKDKKKTEFSLHLTIILV